MSEAQTAKHTFQADTKKVLNLVTQSLYSHKEIFLRELISNASDALGKRSFSALTDPKAATDQTLRIRITVDKDKKTLCIADNGIGMTQEDVVAHLGTIARSGTADFIAKLTGDETKDSELIGQFGVGFYSAFVVADAVSVRTRHVHAAPDEAVRWYSRADGEYTTTPIHKAEVGTEVILELKDDELEFLESYRLRDIVKTHSDHISYPVEMLKEATPPSETEDGEEAPSPEEPTFETINKATALWVRSKSEIKDEDYQAFYKHISPYADDPLAWIHKHIEGTLEYRLLLFIPKRPPFDLWQREARHGVKLYVQRVFIMDDADKLMPNYLRFVKGVIDSNDLPLNVSRELLQSNRVVDNLRAGATKNVLGLLEKLAKDEPETYQTFWNCFGEVLKEGPAEDFGNKQRIAKLLRFASTHQDSDEQVVSLEAYVARKVEGQEKIYYITAENYQAAKHSPQLEIFRKKGIEVLLLFHRVDEWLVSHLSEYEGMPLQSCARGELDLGELDDKEAKAEQEKLSEELKPLIERFKEALGGTVQDVRLTHRLTNSPACIVTGEYDMGLQMQKIMQAAGQAIPPSLPTLELNPHHAIIERLNEEADEDLFRDWALILLDQAKLMEGLALQDVSAYVERVNRLLG